MISSITRQFSFCHPWVHGNVWGISLQGGYLQNRVTREVWKLLILCQKVVLYLRLNYVFGWHRGDEKMFSITETSFSTFLSPNVLKLEYRKPVTLWLMKYRNFVLKSDIQEILSILKLNKSLDANHLHTKQCVITSATCMQSCILEDTNNLPSHHSSFIPMKGKWFSWLTFFSIQLQLQH